MEAGEEGEMGPEVLRRVMWLGIAVVGRGMGRGRELGFVGGEGEEILELVAFLEDGEAWDEAGRGTKGVTTIAVGSIGIGIGGGAAW
jgi:hypothetical protein